MIIVIREPRCAGRRMSVVHEAWIEAFRGVDERIDERRMRRQRAMDHGRAERSGAVKVVGNRST